MTRSIEADYSQTFLLPPSLEDWVGADHPVRFIRDFVESLDLKGLGFSALPGIGPGNPHYSADLLLKIWIYGWLERIRTSRRLERACRQHLALMWLAGMHTPDHNTLSRFFRANRRAMRKLFKRTVQVACQMGLVGLAVHAVDGTKIRAASGTRKLLSREQLEKLLERADDDIAKMEEELEAESRSGDCDEYRLPEKLSDAKSRREQIARLQAELDAGERKLIIPHEPEAQQVLTTEGVRFGYNGQVVVDALNGIIVGQALTTDPFDRQQLVPMLEEVRGNLGANAEYTLADAGYATQEQLSHAKQMGVDVLAPLPDRSHATNPYHSYHFHYDAQRDVCICPVTGELLRFEGLIQPQSTHHAARKYRCHAGKTCPFASQCTKSKTGRRITITEYRQALLDQLAHERNPILRQLRGRRKAIVEPAFAHIKEQLGFRRFTVRHPESAGAQWAWACAMKNIKIMCRNYKRTRPKASQRRYSKGNKPYRPLERVQQHSAACRILEAILTIWTMPTQNFAKPAA